ncbi:putative alpha/beta hydrolase [Shimia isoporae]|uniref:Putative alpha/beta hydrolase n=1 Tax=Shimia isoporae TaxID=647720 RepID=A0A4R1NT70_9RHOB|nr:alpha/beta fold hydrolase [Shimia isoporae]TCL08152.1 putative alpha/beta hydrolase [Shimia isoporae]
MLDGVDVEGVTSEDIEFQAKDGWNLAGSLFRGQSPKMAILISAGTGFPRRFYRHAAAWFAAQGAVVLTYDFRGIGDSGAEDLANSGIDYPHWGQRDMSAALDRLEEAAPGLPLMTLGHSIGGQFVGFMPNSDKITRNAFVSVGSGHWGVHFKHRIPLELFFWWGFGAMELARFGHIRGGGLWGGEALPPGVFKTWRRWSGRRSYLLPDLAAGKYTHRFDQRQAPICAWVLSDDGIATKTACSDTLSHYSQAEKHLVVRTPADLGAKKVGHEGAFRKGREPLWQEIWNWLDAGNLPEGAEDR